MTSTSGKCSPSAEALTDEDDNFSMTNNVETNEDVTNLRQRFSLSGSIGSRSRLSLRAHSAHLPAHHHREESLKIIFGPFEFYIAILALECYFACEYQ